MTCWNELVERQTCAFDANGKTLPYVLYKQKGPSTGLAIMFPGIGYNCSKPLFYYSFMLI